MKNVESTMGNQKKGAALTAFVKTSVVKACSPFFAAIISLPTIFIV
jgi:hypothetical protein